MMSLKSIKNVTKAGLAALFISPNVGLAEEKQSNHAFYGDMIWRYENEISHINRPPRERIRLIARAGIKSRWNETWSTNLRFSTGLRNKQNVPAITVHRFNAQKQPDNDVFVERLYATGKFEDFSVHAGKVPWKTRQNTDAFWDRNLNPIGVHFDVPLHNGDSIKFATFKPLDGASSTIGHMTVLQYLTQWKTDNWTFKFSPWLVDYQGQSGAEFARRDTQFDNRFVRLSASAKYNAWQFGVDVGRSVKTFDQPELAPFHNEKTSVAAEVKYGSLKAVGQYLAHVRYLHVERFGVITEFGQNATAGFLTSNYRGWDLRLRRKMGKNWWLGVRASDLTRLKGVPEEGLRLRFEARFVF